MRTKHLLYTMALAGIFAACTQDEFETVNGADALTGRKSIGQVTFTEAPSTRWAVESWDKIAPEADDAFSLMLVDNPRTGLDGMHLYPIDNYELIEKAQTNYIFRKGNNGWSNEAELVEGNYLYVAPAQEGKLDRNTVEINLPTEQNLTLGADGKVNPLSAIEEFVAKGYPFYIGHRFLSEGGSVSLPNMQSIFAYPEITITQTDAFRDEVAVVKKVIIKQENPGDAFVVNAPLNPKKAATLLTNEFFTKRGEDKQDKVVIGDWAGHANAYFGVDEEIPQNWGSNEWNNTKEIPADTTFVAHNMNGRVLGTYLFNKGLNGATSDLLGDPQSKSQYIVINMPGDGVALKYRESIKFNAVIPAATYEMTEVDAGDQTVKKGLTIYVVLENNEAYKKVVTSTGDESTIDLYPGKRYPVQDYTGLNLNSGAGKYFTIELCEKTDGTNKYIKTTDAEIGGVGTINTTEDLIAAIQGHTSAEPLYLTIEGRNVVYNKAVNDAVTNKRSQQVTIQGHIKVQAEKGTTLNLYSRMLIEDATIAEGGKIVASENNLKKVVVAPKAELELTDVEGVNKQAEITNAGTLTLSTADFVRVDNHGVLKVNYDLANAEGINVEYLDCVDNKEIISMPIDLNPSVEVMPGGVYALTSETLNYPITVDAKTSNEDAGVLILKSNVRVVKDVITLENGKKLEREGKIDNNGLISTETEKTWTLTIATGRTMTVGQEAVVDAALEIEGASVLLKDIEDPNFVTEYIEAAKVINYGTLKKNVKVNGKLVMKGVNSRIEGEITASDETEGEIDNTEKGTIVNEPEGVTVFARFAGLDLTTNETTAAAKEEMSEYGKDFKVTVIRLEGEVKVDGVDRTLNKKDGEWNGDIEGIEMLEFAKGSSLTIGYVILNSDLNIKVSAPDIQWNGRTEDRSKFNFGTATMTRGFYLTTNKQRNYIAKKGYIETNNCMTVAGLEEN
ncbi:MAG TPA: hypothetical protein H9824_12140 [Candidatus Bacteroides pullicola]|uniref:Uncharacterized protein n=1 Tax=Candidatus Bacteroides pullicola TaxID=2838475 RepID=A0A9D1ZNM9_9BACE|nr:hypothetical protein [Candidatus Bacteroides pullicola]